jgi:outer membrane protein TolC
MVYRLLIVTCAIFLFIEIDSISADETPSAGNALTLQDCYNQALNRDERLEMQRERIIQFEQNYKEALGNIFPFISFQFTERFQDTSGVEAGESTFAKTFVRKDTPEAKLTLRQTLFSGFMEYAGLQSLRSSIEREEFNQKNLGRVLFLDVARAFYTVVLLEKNLEDVQKIISIAEERLDEVSRRVKLGKSRRSELLGVEAQIATLRAREEKIRGDIAKAYELLFFLTGITQYNVKLIDELPDLNTLPPEDELLSHLKTRPDFLALKKDVEAKKFSLKVEKRALLPTISLLGNYYLKRVGFQEPIDWDILITLDVPIFQGGAGIARVKEASSVLKEAEFNQSYFLREEESNVKGRSKALRSAIEQRKLLEEAYLKADESYKLYVNEYRLGLVNNLEVIQAMNNVLEAKMALDTVSIENKLALIELKVTAGELP